MRHRTITAVQVTFLDGTVEAFQSVEGFYRSRYHGPDPKNPDAETIEHEIHWIDKLAT